MSEDDDLWLDAQKLRAARLRFEGLPDQTLVQILTDTWERILLCEAVQKSEPTAEAGFVSIASFLLAYVPGNGGFAPYEAKALGMAVHGLLYVITNKARRDQAAEGWVPPS